MLKFTHIIFSPGGQTVKMLLIYSNRLSLPSDTTNSRGWDKLNN